jgi:predicted nucleic acid-binding protein
MIRVVLDTSVIVKSIFRPLRSLSKEAYCREQETHEKCKALIKHEETIFSIAWDVALNTGCAGFDSYFIALAKREDAILLTDDSGMHHHAEEAGVTSILIRSNDLKTLAQRLE